MPREIKKLSLCNLSLRDEKPTKVVIDTMLTSPEEELQRLSIDNQNGPIFYPQYHTHHQEISKNNLDLQLKSNQKPKRYFQTDRILKKESFLVQGWDVNQDHNQNQNQPKKVHLLRMSSEKQRHANMKLENTLIRSPSPAKTIQHNFKTVQLFDDRRSTLSTRDNNFKFRTMIDRVKSAKSSSSSRYILPSDDFERKKINLLVLYEEEKSKNKKAISELPRESRPVTSIVYPILYLDNLNPEKKKDPRKRLKKRMHNLLRFL